MTLRRSGNDGSMICNYCASVIVTDFLGGSKSVGGKMVYPILVTRWRLKNDKEVLFLTDVALRYVCLMLHYARSSVELS